MVIYIKTKKVWKIVFITPLFMFRGIFSVVGLFTATRSYGVTLCGVLILLLYYSVKKQFNTLVRFLIGVILAFLALWYTIYRYDQLQKVSLDGVLQGVVINQRSLNTRVVQTNNQQLLLQSKKQLTPGQSIDFLPKLTRATLPKRTWWELNPSGFFASGFVFDYWLMMKGYVGWGTVRSQDILIKEGPPIRYSLFDRFHFFFKERLQNKIQERKTRALFVGMTIGDRSLFSTQEYDHFVKSGLVHILAVSGSNIVYLSLFLSAVLFWLPFYLRSLLIGISIVMYGLLCGADSSVVRAMTMGVLGLIATRSGRIIPIWVVLQIAAGAMLLWNPLLLRFDLGFLLSFSAVIGIVVVGNRYTTIFPHWRYSLFSKIMVGLFVPLVGATLGVHIILIPVNGYFSFTGFLSNSIIVPGVPIFLLLGLCSLIFQRSIVTQWLNTLSDSLFIIADFIVTSGYTLTFTTLFVRWLFAGLLICFLGRLHYSTKTQERSVSG